MMPIRFSFFPLAGGLALSLACSGGGYGGGSDYTPPPPPPPPYLRAAALRGANEVPSNPSTAAATGAVTVNPTTLAITGSLVSSGLAGSAAHIHEGAKGVAGPVAIPLAGGAGGVWTIPDGTVLTGAQYASLQAGNYYFNIHSAAYPGGEVRGQIELVARFASLDGAQEIPPTGSAATGAGILSVNPATGEAMGAILTEGLTGTVAHVHGGATGVVGAVILPFASAGGGLWNLPGGSLLSMAQVTSFLAGNLYGNVHSAAFPDGEIRGQFGLPSALIRSTTLVGANEVPPNASAATGTGTFAFDPITLELRGGVVFSGFVSTAAHIHFAAAGVAGPVIVPLALSLDGSWVVPEGTFLTPAQFEAFRAGSLYVNVHSVLYPGGEIRGQIPADGGSGGGGGGGGGGGY